MRFYKYQIIWNLPVHSLMFFFLFFFSCYSSTMSSKATLAFLICGVMMHYSVICSPVGLSFPSVRYVHLHLTPTVTFEVDPGSLKGGKRVRLLPWAVSARTAACWITG